MFHAHIGTMDTCARALLAAAAMIEDGKFAAHVDERYAGWSSETGQQILTGGASLDDMSVYVLGRNTDPEPTSGRQELFENLANHSV